MNQPNIILQMMDKVRTHQWFSEVGAARPPFHDVIRTFSEVRDLIKGGQTRLFLKPRYGSSASGVIALRSDGKRYLAMTSVEVADGALFNSLRVRTYRSESEIARIVDTLGQDELIAETWIPKGGFGDETCDLRMVVTRGVLNPHVVVRLSKSPMTNLHLGNRRGFLSEVRARISGETWSDLNLELQRILESKSGAFYSGFDVAFDPKWEQFFILESNAFGDLIPGILEDGLDTYSTQLKAWFSNQSSSS